MLQYDAPPQTAPRFEIGHSGELEPEPSKLVPTALLSLWDEGGASRGPVPIPRRIGMEILLAVPPDARAHDSEPLPTTMGRLAAAVWPGTVRILSDGNVVGYKQTRHGPALLKALEKVHGPKHGSVAWRAGATGARRVLVTVVDWPESNAPDALLVLRVALPPESQQGPQVDKLLLRSLAATSNHQHRMMLTAYYLWDRYGTVKGRLIDPTLPVVLRDSAGYVLDANGKVITERGAPTRRATHERAVQTGERERNPEIDKYQWLEGRDLILACHRTVGDKTERQRQQRHEAYKTAKVLKNAGHLDSQVEFRTVRGGAPTGCPAPAAECWASIRARLPVVCHHACQAPRCRLIGDGARRERFRCCVGTLSVRCTNVFGVI